MNTEETKPEQDERLARLMRSFDHERGQEYNDLLYLVNIAGSLNKGSGIIEKIKAMESIADRLSRSDMVEPRQSFMLWLSDTIHFFNSSNQ